MRPPFNELAEKARLCDEQAQFHKRESARHRRAACEWRRKQADFEAECERLGIEVIYETGEGKKSHGQATTRN